jgi:hypothetical protein
LRSRSNSPAHRRVGLAVADQAQHDRPDQRSVRLGYPVVGALGQPGDGTVHAAGLVVGGEGEAVVLAPLPQLEQGGGQQRQRAGLALDVGDQRVGQRRLDAQPDAAGGQLDGAPQLGGLHRTDKDVVGGEPLGECRVGGEATIEVGAGRGHHDGSAVWIVRRAGEQVREAVSLLVRFAGGEQLLQLVDDQEQSLVGAQRVERGGERVPPARSEDVVQILERPLTGADHHPSPPLTPGQHPAGERRDQPGTEDRRLAAARRTDDAQERRTDEACDEFGDQTLPPEEVLGIGGVEARQSLERAHIGRAGARRHRQRPGPFLCDLKVDHPPGQLGLDVAQNAATGGRPNGDGGQLPARLVDRHRERGPVELEATREPLRGLFRQRRADDGVERGR